MISGTEKGMTAIGFLNLYKPVGITSHDAVQKIRKTFKTRQVGHGGTLDPAAEGVLPIAVGKATRLLSFMSGEKGYKATFRFGQTSTTDDAEGEILESSPCPELTLAQVEQCLEAFVGTIWQIPPQYSAIRHQGQRLYDLARSGVRVEVDPRPVTIERIHCLGWRPGSYPELDLEIDCGTGTYIRSIARDLGQQLHCGGLMSRLERFRSGPFLAQTSVTLSHLQDLADPTTALMPLAAGFPDWPQLRLDPKQLKSWVQGRAIDWDALGQAPLPTGRPQGEAMDPPDTSSFQVVILDARSHCWGIGTWREGRIHPLRVIPLLTEED